MRSAPKWLRVVAEGILLFGGLRLLVTSAGLLLISALTVGRRHDEAQLLASVAFVGIVTAGLVLIASFRLHQYSRHAPFWVSVAAGVGLLDILVSRTLLVGGAAALAGGVLGAGCEIMRRSTSVVRHGRH